MARGANGQQENGPLTWVALIVVVLLIMGTMLWLVASTYIVFYFSPIFHFFGRVWSILPGQPARANMHDIDTLYVLFRYHSASVVFSDWVYYINLCLKPWSLIWLPLAALLYVRQVRSIANRRVNKKVTPESLAHDMIKVFSDNAPVVALQSQIVAGKLPGWRRQTFPVETLEAARYQRQPILVPDAQRGGLRVDEARLRGYLLRTRAWKDASGTKLRESPLLGRQIVDLNTDGKRKDVVFADRLSPVGKAIFAFLAPYAFGSAKGKKLSLTVKDALNYSAYGSASGMANLSVPQVAQAFKAYRAHPLAQKLARLHHWEYTYLYALLRYARRNGKIGTWSTLWLKPMNRVLFYVLNTEGRATPHSEASLAFSQYQFEIGAARMGRLPMRVDKSPSIFVDATIKSYVEEWETWREGEDPDSDKWWQSDEFDPVSSANNAGLVEALRAMGTMPDLPKEQAS